MKFRAPTKKAALVFTDIEGSTNLWEANPCAMRRALDLHNQTIRKLIPEHAGYEYNTDGDAFAVAFHEASDAIAFSLAMQVSRAITTNYTPPWSQFYGIHQQ
jgi:class 3 adenylate cyclase